MKAPISKKAEKILSESPDVITAAVLKEKRDDGPDVIRFSDFCLYPYQIDLLRSIAKKFLEQNIEELSAKIAEEILSEVNHEI